MAKERSGKTAPDRHDVIKAANAQADPGARPDGKVLPSSGGPVLDRAGIQDSGYLDKKGLTDGVDVFYNCLPPGMDIEDQHLADIRDQNSVKTVVALSYPGDGWT